jgi:hypothetical protein
MLKRLTILAVLLAVVCSIPVPGQTTDHGSQPRHNPKQRTDSDKSPAKPTITIVEKNCDSDQFKNDTDCKAAENKESTVAISKLPATNVSIESNAKRDIFDWVAYTFSILLACVGFWGILVARRGVEATEEAAKGALESAKAANAQIQLMKDKERTRLVIRVKVGPNIGQPEAIIDNYQMVVARVFVVNEGLTKAFNVEAFGMLTTTKDKDGVPWKEGFRQEIPRTIGDTDGAPVPLNVTGMGLTAKTEGFNATEGDAFDG